MNATAARLGMTRTKFANANGLPAPEQVTTARDLARLAAAVVRDYPEYAHMWSMLDVQGRQAPPAHPQRPAHQLRGRRRPEDRLHLRQRLQRRRQRHPRRPQADRRGAGRGHRRRAHACAPPTCSSTASRRYEWKALFAPPTLETMPMAEDAKGPMTMRQAVMSYECGTAAGVAPWPSARRRARPVSEQQKAPAKKAKSRKASAPAASQQ